MNLTTSIDSQFASASFTPSPLLTLCRANSHPSILKYLSNSDFLCFSLTSKYFQKNLTIDSEAFIQAFYIQKNLTPGAWKKFILKHPSGAKLSALAANQLEPFKNFNDRDVKIAILNERLRWNPTERDCLIKEALTLPSKKDPVFTQISQLSEIGRSIMDISPKKDFDLPIDDNKTAPLPQIKAKHGTWGLLSKPFHRLNPSKQTHDHDDLKNATDCFKRAYQLLLTLVPLHDHFSELDDPKLGETLFFLVQGYSSINSEDAYKIACLIDELNPYKIPALLYLAKKEVENQEQAAKYLFEAIKIIGEKPITHQGQFSKIIKACRSLPLGEFKGLMIEHLENPEIPLLCELYNHYAENGKKKSEIFSSILQAFENLPTGKCHNNTNALYGIKIIKTLRTNEPTKTADLIKSVENIIAKCEPFMQIKLLSKLCKQLLPIDYKKSDEVYQQAFKSIDLLKGEEQKLEALSILLQKTYFDKIHPEQSEIKEQPDAQILINSSNPKKSKWRWV